MPRGIKGSGKKAAPAKRAYNRRTIHLDDTAAKEQAWELYQQQYILRLGNSIRAEFDKWWASKP